MPASSPVPWQSTSERILSWYALVQDVYEQAEALPCSTAEQAVSFMSLLGRAATHFGLDEFVHCQGRRPSPPEPGVMLFPLPPLHALASDLGGSLPPGMTEAPLFETREHFLLARAHCPSQSVETLHLELQRFVGHVVRCIEMRQRLVAAQRSLAAMYEALDRQDLSVILCDAQGRPRFYNRAAIRLRARYAELTPDASITAPGRRPMAQLVERFRQNLRAGDNRVVHLCTDTLLLTLVPLLSHPPPAVFAADGPSLGFIVQERASSDERPANGPRVLPEITDRLSHRLQARWALTPAEARLSFGLCAGLSIADYATLSQRSPLTLRKQLKAIFRKLNVEDQKSLILRIWQEQRADWLECVILMALPDAAPASAELLYPRPQPTCTGAPTSGPTSHQVSLFEGDRVDG